jgi:hypothetical protein
MKRSPRVPLLVALTLLAPAPALADIETWDWFEARLPLTEGQWGMPQSLRLLTDARFGGRFPGGLGQMFFRVGPLWELHPNLLLAVHCTFYVNQFDPAGRPGTFETVIRPELEPNIRGRIGEFTLNDRNRLEYAYSPTRPEGSFWRYRNQLRVNHQPVDSKRSWFPYIWDEVLFPFNAGFNQNRLSAGLAFLLGKHARLETGYILRSRATASGAWEHDHIFNLYLFYAPDIPALFQKDVPAGQGE